jgi:hypothetical protein
MFYWDIAQSAGIAFDKDGAGAWLLCPSGARVDSRLVEGLRSRGQGGTVPDHRGPTPLPIPSVTETSRWCGILFKRGEDRR